VCVWHVCGGCDVIITETETEPRGRGQKKTKKKKLEVVVDWHLGRALYSALDGVGERLESQKQVDELENFL